MEVNMKILFEKADILYGDDLEVVVNGYLVVQEDKIIYVGTEKPTDKYDIVKDMSNKLLMPGLFNSHSHAAMTLLRGVGTGYPLQEWLFDNVIPIEDKLVANDIRVGNELAILEMISTGTVSYSDMYDRPVAQMEAVKKAKIKINICRPIIAFGPEEFTEKSNKIIEKI